MGGVEGDVWRTGRGSPWPQFLPTAPEGVLSAAGSQKNKNLRRTLWHLSVELCSSLLLTRRMFKGQNLGQCWLLAPPALEYLPWAFSVRLYLVCGRTGAGAGAGAGT